MNIFKVNLTVVMIVVAMIQTVMMTHAAMPSSTIAAYNNKISHISYSLGSDDQHAITFLCQNNPICMYTPLTYEDSFEKSLTKTYFLPRTKSLNSGMQKYYHELRENLQEIGIDLDIHEIEDDNYGLSMSFTMQSDDTYDIVKVIDSDKKTVRFDIVAKI